MIRIHLVQIYFHPAYYDSPINYLEEPILVDDLDGCLGNIRSSESVSHLLRKTKDSYLRCFSPFIMALLEECKSRKPDIIVFPEYSIPIELVGALVEFCKANQILIIAGSHRVEGTPESKKIYSEVGLFTAGLPIGNACVPIIFPDGQISHALKLKRSKWEQNLKVDNTEPVVFSTKINGHCFDFSVVPCIDSLHPDIIGNLMSRADRPQTIFCPSLSPSTTHFSATGSLLSLNETLFAYVNAANHGETSFNLPEKWTTYLKGHTVYASVPKGTEAILELDYDPSAFFQKLGTIKPAVKSKKTMLAPIVFGKRSAWLKEYNDLVAVTLQCLKEGEPHLAVDFINSFLIDEGQKIPATMLGRLKYLQHSYLPLYDGDVTSVTDLLHIMQVNDVEGIVQFNTTFVRKAITCITELITTEIDQSDFDRSLKILSSLKKAVRALPPLEQTSTEEINKTIGKHSFQGDEYLLEAFQNRGSDLEQVRNYFKNPDNRLIVVTGAIGIGKTDFINWAFRKQFGDWSTIIIRIPDGGKVSRMIADIAYYLGISIDIDALANASPDTFRQRVRKILSKFFTVPKRALILDDVHSILKDGNAKDYKHLLIFIEEAATPHDYLGGRIFLLSSQWLQEKWLQKSAIAHLKLKPVKDIYCRRIIEFHMRRCQLFAGEIVPDTPQELLDLIKGHPLSAKLLVEALDGKGFEKLTQDITVRSVSGHVAKELLKLTHLSEAEETLFKRFSVFRLPINLNLALKIETLTESVRAFMYLRDRCIVNFDGVNLSTHESIRRHFYSQLDVKDKKLFHKHASIYYKDVYDEQKHLNDTDPSITCELIHHLCMAEEFEEACSLRFIIIDEFKPSARKLYQEYKDYNKALELYRLIHSVVPEDVEVIAYIGRCYARIGQWSDCDASFEKAIEISIRNAAPLWWIYRDWGQIKVRYQFFTDAKKLLERAENLNRNNASIKSSLAYMHWRQGSDKELIYQLFEKAHNFDPYHEYTLYFFSKFLEDYGDYPYAERIREKYLEIKAGTRDRNPLEHDIDFDYDE